MPRLPLNFIEIRDVSIGGQEGQSMSRDGRDCTTSPVETYMQLFPAGWPND